MTNIERGLFVRLMNRGGYVLDFSTADFDSFTMKSIGIGLCAKYNLSKGASLTRFTQEGDGKLVDKLLLDLLNYYEILYTDFERETTDNGASEDISKSNYGSMYRKCKEVANRLSPSGQYVIASAQNITEAFSSDYIDNQVQIMLSMQKENPTEAIGKSKELIESCCKAILESHNKQYDKNWDVPKLTNETMSLLKVTPEDIPNEIKGEKNIKAILGNLKSIATNVAELRNMYGSGHGKSPTYKGLEERHAKLAIGSTLTLVNFLWDSHLRVVLNNKGQNGI